MSIGNYSKAIIGGLASACAAAAPLLQDGRISEADGLIIAGAFLASLGVVYIVPNASASQGHAKPTSQDTTTPATTADAPAAASDADVSTSSAPAAIPAMPDADGDSAPATPVDAGVIAAADDAPAVPIATDAPIHQGA